MVVLSDQRMLFLIVSEAFMWFYLGFTEEKPFKSQAADLLELSPIPRWTEFFNFRMVETGWRDDENMHLMADRTIFSIVYQKNKWLEDT